MSSVSTELAADAVEHLAKMARLKAIAAKNARDNRIKNKRDKARGKRKRKNKGKK